MGCLGDSDTSLTLGFGLGHDLTVRRIEPHVGLCTGSEEPAWDSLSLCPSHAHSPTLSKKQTSKKHSRPRGCTLYHITHTTDDFILPLSLLFFLRHILLLSLLLLSLAFLCQSLLVSSWYSLCQPGPEEKSTRSICERFFSVINGYTEGGNTDSLLDMGKRTNEIGRAHV